MAFYSEVCYRRSLAAKSAGALDMARPHRRFELLAKIGELFGAQIADRAQIEALLRLELDVDALHGLDSLRAASAPCVTRKFMTWRSKWRAAGPRAGCASTWRQRGCPLAI